MQCTIVVGGLCCKMFVEIVGMAEVSLFRAIGLVDGRAGRMVVVEAEIKTGEGSHVKRHRVSCGRLCNSASEDANCAGVQPQSIQLRLCDCKNRRGGQSLSSQCS